MARLSHNIVSNFLGRAWSLLMGVAFVPLYLRLLGVEGYGLVGLFAALQAMLVLADFGLSLTIARNLAQTDDRLTQGRFLRTYEVVYWVIAAVLGVLMILGARVIAETWIRTERVSVETVETAIRFMGLALSAQMPSMLYLGGLNGLQRQVTSNLIQVVTSSLRWGAYRQLSERSSRGKYWSQYYLQRLVPSHYGGLFLGEPDQQSLIGTSCAGLGDSH
jgi:O-antigen/teichoic acid export membrane protein